MSKRRRILRRLLIALAALLAVSSLALADAFLIEPNVVVAHRVTLSSAELPASWVGRRIVVFSDLHAGGGLSVAAITRIAERIRKESPDLVLFLGDAVDSTTPDDAAFLDGIGKALARIDAPLGKFAVLGNHDDRLRLERGMFTGIMAQGGFQVLVNQSVTVDGVVIGGLAESYFGNPDIGATFPAATAGSFRILLAHQPLLGMSQEVLSKAAPDLVFSGHTHGGQVTLFGIPILNVPGGGPYNAGTYVSGGTTLFVTRGLGTYGIRARFFCLPEYVVVTLSR